MNYFKYLKKNLDSIIFLELKEEQKLGRVHIPKDLPLPILLDRVVADVEKTKLQEKVDLELVTEAIGILLGTDTNFIHKEAYLNILEDLTVDIYEYYYKLGYINEVDKKFEFALGYYNFLDHLYEKEEVKFKKINMLEQIYNNRFSKLEEEEKENLLKDIIQGYEKLTLEYPKLSLAWYRLGYIYLATERYIKSKLYFEHFLTISEDDDLKEEVRIQLNELEDYASIEAVKTYIAYSKYTQALKRLSTISSLYPNPEEVFYLKGKIYYAIGEFSEAIKNYREALKKIKNNPDLYNELAVSYIRENHSDKALEVYRKAVFHIKNHDSLLYNKGILEVNFGDKEKGIRDLKTSYQLNQNEDILNIIKEIDS